MHIRSLQVRAYKSLASVKFRPPRLAVISGPTGSGKTAILECVRLAQEMIVRKDVRKAIIGWPPQYTTGHAPRDETPSIVVESRMGRAVAVPDESTPAEWRVRFPTRSQAVTNVPVRDTVSPDFYLAPLYHLHATALARPAFLSFPTQRLGHDGARLAPVLGRLLGRHRERFERIEARLKNHIPWVKAVHVVPAPVPGHDGIMGQALAFDTLAGDGIPAGLVGCGVLHFLAILTLLEEDQPDYLMLEEPERGLHPALQAAIVGLVRETLERRRDYSILMTTHAQAILDGLQPSEFFLTRLDDAGYTQLKCMSDLENPRAWSKGSASRSSERI